jgi:hypothetical protein
MGLLSFHDLAVLASLVSLVSVTTDGEKQCGTQDTDVARERTSIQRSVVRLE